MVAHLCSCLRCLTRDFSGLSIPSPRIICELSSASWIVRVRGRAQPQCCGAGRHFLVTRSEGQDIRPFARRTVPVPGLPPLRVSVARLTAGLLVGRSTGDGEQPAQAPRSLGSNSPSIPLPFPAPSPKPTRISLAEPPGFAFADSEYLFDSNMPVRRLVQKHLERGILAWIPGRLPSASICRNPVLRANEENTRYGKLRTV